MSQAKREGVGIFHRGVNSMCKGPKEGKKWCYFQNRQEDRTDAES
jgi:hypothetical protein